jgi:hypothetical protein
MSGRKESSKVVKIDGSWTLASDWDGGGRPEAESPCTLPFVAADSLAESQADCSAEIDDLDFFGCGELEGESGRFSGREKALLSVSVAEVAELDMRRES